MSGPTRPGGPVHRQVPPGDNRERLVCTDCGFVHYDNPRIIVGAVCTWEDRVLMCRRAIAPRHGYWNLPAGYLELGEAVEAGVEREAWEEATARISVDALLALYSVVHLSQVHLYYRARLLDAQVAPGEESLEVKLFARDEIPWSELAFPSVRWALEHHFAVAGEAVFTPFRTP